MIKKLFLFLLLTLALPMAAQNTSFPKKGYNIKWIKRTASGFQNYSCTIKKFKDSDSIYYISYVTPDLQPYCICFSFLHQKGAEMIADALESRNRQEKIRWIKAYLNYTQVYDVDHITRYNEYWTYFKPKINERDLVKHFNLSSAIYAYNRDRDRDARWANITPDQWLQLYEAAKVVLPLMGAGADGRTLYDKIMQDGGY